MAITPQTEIRLLKVPFKIDNINQLTFNNIQAQTNYFENLDYIEIENCQYQRKDNIIYFPGHIDSLINYNYVMYKNNNYSNKWFYAFITDMKYNNDGLTDIYIKTDCFQTWQFNLIYKEMFVEREHVSNDTIGLHTIDENLNVGEVIEEKEVIESSLSEFFYIVIQSEYDPKTKKDYSFITCYNGQLFSTPLFLFKYQLQENTSQFTNIINFIRDVMSGKRIESIQNIFVVPASLIDESKLELVQMEDYSFYKLNYTYSAEEFNINVEKQHSFSDYVPKNNKCFVYPYNYLLVSNNNGNQNIYKYEDFSNSNNATFKISLAMQIGCSGRLFPLNYKKNAIANDESLPLGKYPTFSWSGDAFVNWLTQNAVNASTSILNTGTNVTQNVASGDLLSAGLNISDAISSQIGSFYTASLLPNIVGGQNTGDVNFSCKQNTFVFRCMRAKTEYLKVIDEFFLMYGYKVNEVKIPNLKNRPNWNYVKSINANILGDIPQDDLQEIKDIFNSGVTLWHNPNTFLDYSQNNK